MDKLAKSAVHYRAGTDLEHCGICAMYKNGKCDLVEGSIDSEDRCDRWVPKPPEVQDTWDALRSRSWDPLPKDDMPSLLAVLSVAQQPCEDQQHAVREWLGSSASTQAPESLKSAALKFVETK